MKATTCAFFLLLCVECHADEVVLKDGRRIEWAKLEDLGDTYVITTPENQRIVVKRSEVESIAKTEHVSPLTGAQASFDKKAKLDQVDLLKRVEFTSGTWKQNPDGSVFCTKPGPTEASSFSVKMAPDADEYNLTVVIERDGEGDNLAFGLMGPGGAKVTYMFDIDMGKESCVFTGERKRLAVVPGRQFNPKKPRTITFMVRKSGLIVQLDGKDFATARTDWKLTPFPGICPAEPGFGFAALGAGVRVSKLSLTVPAAPK